MDDIESLPEEETDFLMENSLWIQIYSKKDPMILSFNSSLSN